MNRMQADFIVEVYEHITKLRKAQDKGEMYNGMLWSQGTWGSAYFDVEDTETFGGNYMSFEGTVETSCNIPTNIENSEHKCGTAACLAGWVYLLDQTKGKSQTTSVFARAFAKLKNWKNNQGYYIGDTGEMARKILGWNGTSDSEADVFDAHNSLEDIRICLNRIFIDYGFEDINI